MILRMPASTADNVTSAFCPLASGARTLIRTGVSGRIFCGASKVTFNFRSLRSRGRWIRPRARAGVTRSPALPGRSTITETYKSCRVQSRLIGISTVAVSEETDMRFTQRVRLASTVISASP